MQLGRALAFLQAWLLDHNQPAMTEAQVKAFRVREGWMRGWERLSSSPQPACADRLALEAVWCSRVTLSVVLPWSVTVGVCVGGCVGAALLTHTHAMTVTHLSHPLPVLSCCHHCSAGRLAWLAGVVCYPVTASAAGADGELHYCVVLCCAVPCTC